MWNLEVKHSLFTNHTIELLLKSYDIGKNVRCSFLTRGLNDTYLVETETNQYIFRIYRKDWRNQSDILFEMDAINHAAENGVAVSKPLMRKDGQWITEIHASEGTRYGVLFYFSKGERPEINTDNCYIIGKTLAALHTATDSFHSSHNRNFELNINHLLDEPSDLIISFLRKLGSNKEEAFKKVTTKLKSQFAVSSHLEYSFCHGDFHNFNMHLADQSLEVFDFDCCGVGYRAYDVAVFLWNLKQNYSSLEQPCWDAFMNGYLSNRNMSDDSIKDVMRFVTLRRIWFLGILLKNDDVWGTVWVNQNNFNHFISQLERDGENN
ncbi:phosphotransferase enzyme family protein [Pseudoneobacillus sp. C159]